MNSMVICLIIFAVMIILFFNRKIPMAFTSMGVIVALYVAGCVDKATVFAGFGNNNVLTMAGMFIVAAGLSRTQMVNNITKLLYRVNNVLHASIGVLHFGYLPARSVCPQPASYVCYGLSSGYQHVQTVEVQPL